MINYMKTFPLINWKTNCVLVWVLYSSCALMRTAVRSFPSSWIPVPFAKGQNCSLFLSYGVFVPGCSGRWAETYPPKPPAGVELSALLKGWLEELFQGEALRPLEEIIDPSPKCSLDSFRKGNLFVDKKKSVFKKSYGNSVKCKRGKENYFLKNFNPKT